MRALIDGKWVECEEIQATIEPLDTPAQELLVSLTRNNIVIDLVDKRNEIIHTLAKTYSEVFDEIKESSYTTLSKYEK